MSAITTLRELQEQVALATSQIALELGSTQLGDSHEFRMNKIEQLNKIADTLKKIDTLAAAIEKTDTGPFEYISIGVT